MNWVEKSSIEKIRRLLEIFERERHCQVLLTPENISVVRHNPAPYTLPVIPRPLPSHVVEGEHFVIADLRRLVSGNASSSKKPVIEASSRVQGVGSTSRSSTPRAGVLVRLCDAPNPGGPLTTRQPAGYKWMSGYPTPLQKIGQSLLYTGSSTQIQYLHIPFPNSPICHHMSKTATWAHKQYS